MKLQKQKSDYTRDYHKFVIVIPNEIVKQSGLKEGEELKVKVKKGKIILEKE